MVGFWKTTKRLDLSGSTSKVEEMVNLEEGKVMVGTAKGTAAAAVAAAVKTMMAMVVSVVMEVGAEAGAWGTGTPKVAAAAAVMAL
uniref:Uncharacterized protein n=1 Tax=Arundo donax TaxID=35708 RepID=A0A0A9AFU1_ARUDO